MRPLAARPFPSTLPRLATALALATAMLTPLAASAVVIDWVTVGSPGNTPDADPVNCGPSNASPCGAVATVYKIGKYEVTNAQYAEFLNKVAATDTNALYNTGMGGDATFGGITRSGSSGSYSYPVKPGFESKPVTFVSFWDAARFANWLHNGQPTGLQTSLTTEDGAYTLTPAAIAANSVLRNPSARVFVPNENEWYKAAYYDPIARLYYDYPTGTDTQTGCVAPGGDTGNSANCSRDGSELTNVGAYFLSESPSGTFDQGGNLYEWHEQIKYGGSRGLRGGAWVDSAGLLAAGYSLLDDPAHEWGFGFRVASIPEQCEVDLGQCGSDLFTCEAAKSECIADLVVVNAAWGQTGTLLDQCTVNEKQCQTALALVTQERDAAEAKISRLDAEVQFLRTRLDACEGHPPNLACQADLSGDGIVNFKDLGLFKSVFFKKCEPTP